MTKVVFNKPQEPKEIDYTCADMRCGQVGVITFPATGSIIMPGDVVIYGGKSHLVFYKADGSSYYADRNIRDYRYRNFKKDESLTLTEAS